MNRILSNAWLVSLALWIGATSVATAHDPVSAMAVAAQRFLDSLDQQQQQQSQAMFQRSDEERMNWHFVPDNSIEPGGTRRGLPIHEMNAAQQALAHGLLNSGLSHRGFLTAMTVVSLEQILHELENNNPIRDPSKYYVSVFGEPSREGTWGWRFEGHHLSVNFTIVDGELLAVTPSFFGANPAIVPAGRQKGLQALRDEEALARDFVASFDRQQRKAAIIQESAPDDIITGQERRADQDAFMPPRGIHYDDLDEHQQQALMQLVKVYAEKYRPEVVEQVDRQSDLFNLAEAYFAWAGSTEPGRGHYYRVQTPKFLFEYDNTQNNANHVHAVWRDFDGDFGADLLRNHYEQSHAASGDR